MWLSIYDCDFVEGGAGVGEKAYIPSDLSKGGNKSEANMSWRAEVHHQVEHTWTRHGDCNSGVLCTWTYCHLLGDFISCCLCLATVSGN